MKILKVLFVILPSLATLCVGLASPSIVRFDGPIRSGVKQANGLGGIRTAFSYSCTTPASGSPIYINEISLVPGTPWNSGLTFRVAQRGSTVGQLGFETPQNDYTLGQPLKAGYKYLWERVVDHSGIFPGNIAPGIYNFALVWKGGGSPSARDVLFIDNLAVEIVEKIDVVSSTIHEKTSIGQADSTLISLKLTNTSGNRGLVLGNSLHWQATNSPDTLIRTWEQNFGKATMSPGESRQGSIYRLSSSAIQKGGTYRGGVGVAVGLYKGDGYTVFSPTSVSVSAPANWISGQIALGSFLGSVTDIPIELSFWDGGKIGSITLKLNSSGGFSRAVGVAGTFTVKARASHWLTKQLGIFDFTTAGIVNANGLLLNGDIDWDNEVSLLDYFVLSDYYQKTDSDGSWAVVGENGFAPFHADLDEDGEVSLLDYFILSDNWLVTGD